MWNDAGHEGFQATIRENTREVVTTFLGKGPHGFTIQFGILQMRDEHGDGLEDVGFDNAVAPAEPNYTTDACSQDLGRARLQHMMVQRDGMC